MEVLICDSDCVGCMIDNFQLCKNDSCECKLAEDCELNNVDVIVK